MSQIPKSAYEFLEVHIHARRAEVTELASNVHSNATIGLIAILIHPNAFKLSHVHT